MAPSCSGLIAWPRAPYTLTEVKTLRPLKEQSTQSALSQSLGSTLLQWVGSATIARRSGSSAMLLLNLGQLASKNAESLTLGVLKLLRCLAAAWSPSPGYAPIAKGRIRLSGQPE